MKSIDYPFLYNLIKKAKKEQLKESFCHEEKTQGALLASLYGLVPEGIKETVFRPYFLGKAAKTEQEHYAYANRWDHDFLLYILEHKHLSFDLKAFSEGEQNEIIQFLKNRITLSVFNKYPAKKMFLKENKKMQKQYSAFMKHIQGERITYKKKKYTFSRALQPPIFYHDYGISLLPNKIIQKITQGDAIDCGAYIGESAVILSAFNPKKIIAFEPVPAIFADLKKTVRMNELKTKCECLGVGNKQKTVSLVERGIGSSVSDEGDTTIKITTIDAYVKKHKLKPSLIKMDIEGYELEAVKGAEKIIKKHKPILIICIYHTGKDFFEIIPLLKKWVPKYKFKFANLNQDHPTDGRVIIGYV